MRHRRIAALTVFVDHLLYFRMLPTTGWAGRLLLVFRWSDVAVYFFFVLSGFVMSYVYPSPVRWGRFFRARLARLAPVYEASLLALLPLLMWRQIHGTSASIYHPPITAFNIGANLLMVQEWLPVKSWYSINHPAWSLSVEAFLYAVPFPLLIALRRSGLRTPGFVVLLMLGVVVGAFYFNHQLSLCSNRWPVALVVGCLGFGAGFALEQLGSGFLRYGKAFTLAAFGLVGGSLFCRVIFPLSTSHVLLVPGLLFLVACSAHRAGLAYRILAHRGLLFLGDISYSLYLWHLPLVLVFAAMQARLDSYFHLPGQQKIVHALGTMLLVGGVFLVATLSYHYLEVPFRRMIRDRFVRPQAGAPTAN